MKEAENVQLFTRNLITNNRNWEHNEDFFMKFKNHIADLGDSDFNTLFDSLEGYIRWKGKEDSANYFGRSMLRKFIRKL